MLVYKLHPSMIGGLDACAEDLARVAAMGFDHVLVAGEAGHADDAARSFCEAATRNGLRPLCHLDTRSVDDPEALTTDGERLRDLGWKGVRVLAASAWSTSLWQRVLPRWHDGDSPLLCIADAIGAPASEGLALAVAGFDAIIDSGAWWDGEAPWYLEQRNALARFCHPLTFIEDASIGRLRARLPAHPVVDLARAYANEYAWALCRSHGVITPMGFEHASALPLNGIQLGAGDWARSQARAEIDLQESLAELHAAMLNHPVFDAPGRIMPLPVRSSAGPHAVQALHRTGEGASATAMIVLRRKPGSRAEGLIEADLQGAAFAGDTGIAGASECTPAPMRSGAHMIVSDDDADDTAIELAACQLRCFAVHADAARAEPLEQDLLLRRLEELAPERVAIENVSPRLDDGRFPVKRVIGDVLEVDADVFCDGHDIVRAALRIRHSSQSEFAGSGDGADRQRPLAGAGPLTRIGQYEYTVVGWRAPVATWLADARKKRAAGQDLALERHELKRLLAQAYTPELEADHARIDETIASLATCRCGAAARIDELLDGSSAEWLERLDQRESVTVHETIHGLTVDRARAMFSAWYEIFPRSAADDVSRHGTFDDVIARLPAIEAMGFDVLYFPPIHPIGRTNRKGRNNSLSAGADEPGSPYAIGAQEGGHDAIHPELGTLDDFRRLVAAAAEHGMEIALDFAIQCSPDHPWLREHPEWFDWRPDGSLRYAENPPKKYEDITNVNFYAEGAMPSLWLTLREVVKFWIGHGVKIFRVDNPHTKPYPFWEWLIETVQAEHPDALFLSEAFTRPKVMARLAKAGFSQSYTYFTWRNNKNELTDYLTELTHAPLVDTMRPNFFVNTPDINPIFLQTSGRAGFIVRATLAATLSPSWGMLAGYELCESEPLPGREEYLDSEKYQLRARDWNAPGNIIAQITRLNRIRQLNPALWQLRNLEFHQAGNPQVIAYSKWTDGLDNLVLVAVNLDPHRSHGCDIEIPLWRFGLSDHDSMRVADLIDGQDFFWHGKRQHIHLEPDRNPIGIWRLSPSASAGGVSGSVQ
ncbi:MAG: alpha-1,4-glucan--maltose-1-phosphate maltosyltransferase [Burkholderiaceae bacterium]